MQAGAMTRNVPWLIECHPEPFLEISTELAGELSITDGDMVNLTSARGSVKVKASVTGRLKPFTINGKKVHEVAMPWHWGFKCLSSGPSANDLTMDAVDYHANIPETKVCLCNISKSRGV
jgi:formate dehydrogenase major subunit